MNKYQNALNRIDMLDYISAIDDCISIDSRFIEDIETLKELVDKEIPMKPRTEHFGEGYYGAYCKKCDSPVVIRTFKYCPECGQRIDWGKHE